MSSLAMIGAVIVQLAILCYTIGIVMEQRSRRVSAHTLQFLVAGVVFDILATGCMIAGSSAGLFTPHGVLGFSSLAAMLLETTFAWRHRSNFGDDEVPRWLHLYSRFAYLWWIAAYVTGLALVIVSRRG